MEQYNRKHQELAHRLLQVIRKLEFFQSRGLSWYREEEAFHARLEHIQRELNKPTQFKGDIILFELYTFFFKVLILFFYFFF